MRSNWLVCLGHRPGAKVRLLCFPYGGAGPSVFSDWAKEFPDEVELWSAYLPGRGARLAEAPVADLAVVTERIITKMRQLDGPPWAFYGHSLGGLMAFELARSLRRQGQALPEILLVGGSRAPHLPYPFPSVRKLPDEALVERLRTFGGTPAELFEEQDLLRAYLPAMRADFTIIETYRPAPEPPLSCPIAAFAASEDQLVIPEEVVPWREHTSAGFDYELLPGTHFFMREPPARDAVVRQLLAHAPAEPRPSQCEADSSRLGGGCNPP